jgi:membrane protein DedA with SNARE-associated domain
MEFINQAVLHAAGQWWIYPLLLVFFFVDGFAMVVPSETLIVALAAYSLHSGQPNLWLLALTALVGAMAGDNMAYMLGRKIGLERFRWMRKPKVQKVFAWAHYELEKRGAVLIFTARYIPWGRVAVNYVSGTTSFPHRRFFFLDAIACVTWVGYSIGIGVLASSFPWLHHNPLLSAGIAVVFAIVLGVLIDHLLRWWHKRLGRNDTRPAPAASGGTSDGASVPRTAPQNPAAQDPAAQDPAAQETAPQGHGTMLAGPPTEAGASRK